MSNKKTPKKTNAEAAGMAPVASFFGWQLYTCKALNAPQDVLQAVLDRDRQYTLAEAKEAIEKFMSRKV